MRAVLKTAPGPGSKTVTDAPVPELKEDEVRIKVAAAAVCGTDVHLFEWDKSAQDFNPKLPLVMGHECSGIVDAIGSSVKSVKPGDRVSMETHFFCGHCYQCRIGNAHNCLNMGLPGLTRDGVFAEYATIPANVCFQLPESVPMEIGALFEPAGVSTRALQRAGNVAGNSVLVAGCGPIGLVITQLSVLFGASKVVATDVNPHRLRMAEQLGAIALNAREVDVMEFCRKEFSRSAGVDVAFEATGSPRVLPTLFESVRREGRIVTVGHPGQEVSIDIAAHINKKGIVLSGIFGRRIWDTWETLLALVESGRLDLSWLITYRLPFEEFEHGVELLSGNAAKVILHP